MEVIQLVKKLNNTEVGKSGMHDKYVLIPKNLEVSDIFPIAGEHIDLLDKQSGDIMNVYYKVDGEKRVYGMSSFYSLYDLQAGDAVVFERQITGEESQYFINHIKNDNTILFQKMKYGFEILNPERQALITPDAVTKTAARSEKVEVLFNGTEKKRRDSPKETESYDVRVGGRSIGGDYSRKEILEMTVYGDKTVLKKFVPWKKYKFGMEEDNE